MSSPRGTILRYTADRSTVAIVLALFAAQLAVWHTASALWASVAAVALFVPAVTAACIHHNHQHLNVFRAQWLNRLFELPLALQTGVGSYTWVLHHNLGHHQNYLVQRQGKPTRRDESHWMRDDGSTMGRVEYTLRLFGRHHLDVYRVGRRHPRIYRSYLAMHTLVLAVIALLFWVHPVNTLILFVALPGLVLLHTCSATYEHHSGLETDDPFQATRNRTSRVYNLLSQNLGYHTAHHVRPGLHWSELPAYHAEIEASIPPSHINPHFW